MGDKSSSENIQFNSVNFRFATEKWEIQGVLIRVSAQEC